MPTDSAYHVKLNGKGYVLLDESYASQPQRPFNPRFSTGDPSYGDLSFWQWITQEKFDGGMGQEDFVDKTKIQAAIGWDLSTGKPRLSGGNEQTLVSVPLSHRLHRHFSNSGKFVIFGKPTYGNTYRIALCGLDINDSQDSSRVILRDPTDQLVGIDVVRSKDMAVWERRGGLATGGRFLIATHNTGSNPGFRGNKVFGSNYSLIADHLVVESAWDPQLIIPINAENFFIVGVGPRGSGAPPGYDGMLQYSRRFLQEDWSAGELYPGTSGDFPGRIVSHYAKDGNASLYVAGCPDFGTGWSSDHGGSAIAIWTQEDIFGSELDSRPNVSEFVRYPDLLITGLVSIIGQVYILGARVYQVAGQTMFKNTVVKFPDTTIWEGHEMNYDRPRDLIKAISQEGRHEAYFIAPVESGSYDAIMRLSVNDVVEPVSMLPRIIPDSPGTEDCTWMALIRMHGSFYAYNSKDNFIYRSRLDASLPRNPTDGELVLTTSAYGGNTPLIEKTPRAILIGLTKSVPVGEELRIYINDTFVGTMVNADGLEKRIEISADLSATKFVVKIVADAISTWQGELDRLSLQYVPSPFKKKAWGFAIRATHGLKLINGQRESRTADDIMQDIIAAWESKTPIPFTDIDGREYTVLVTDYKARQPLQADAQDRREYLVPIELLEV